MDLLWGLLDLTRIPVPMNTVLWSDRPNGVKLQGAEKYSEQLVKIWSRILSSLVGKVTAGFRLKVLRTEFIIGRSVLLKSPATMVAELGYFASRDTSDDTM